MLSSVNASVASSLLGSGKPSAGAKTTGGAKDAFSQQLLSILKDGLERLSVKDGNMKAVPSSSSKEPDSASSSAQCQFVVTVPADEPLCSSASCRTCDAVERDAGTASTAQAAERSAGATTEEGAMPETLFEEHDGWNYRNYASREMAEWLAARLGGEVSTYEADWSPGFEQPPTYYTIKFGDVEMNAGALAVYYQPGDYVQPDRMAAMFMSGEGVNNTFVTENFPELANA